MSRMRTFLLYALGIIGFMFLSYVLENSLIYNMYKTMSGEIIPSSYNVLIEDASGKASNVNGYMSFKLTNNSQSVASNQYIKIDLYSKQGLYAMCKYVRVEDLGPNSSKNYQVKFKGNEISSYKLSLVNELPDKSNVINILGWEFDLSNVLGMDLTNAELFGVRIADIFSWENVYVAGSNAFTWIKVTVKAIPWWGYAIATGIVLWYMPNGFLFGFFPF